MVVSIAVTKAPIDQKPTCANENCPTIRVANTLSARITFSPKISDIAVKYANF